MLFSVKFVAHVKGALNEMLMSDSYKVVVLFLDSRALRKSSGNELLSWFVMSTHWIVPNEDVPFTPLMPRCNKADTFPVEFS